MVRKDTSVQTDRLIRAAVLMMNGDQDAAEKWLHSPLEILGNATPLSHAESEKGAQEVEALIGRIVDGVFS